MQQFPISSKVTRVDLYRLMFLLNQCCTDNNSVDCFVTLLFQNKFTNSSPTFSAADRSENFSNRVFFFSSTGSWEHYWKGELLTAAAAGSFVITVKQHLCHIMSNVKKLLNGRKNTNINMATYFSYLAFQIRAAVSLIPPTT